MKTLKDIIEEQVKEILNVTYFEIKHSNCSIECSKKDMEQRVKEDVKEILETVARQTAESLRVTTLEPAPYCIDTYDCNDGLCNHKDNTGFNAALQEIEQKTKEFFE